MPTITQVISILLAAKKPHIGWAQWAEDNSGFEARRLCYVATLKNCITILDDGKMGNATDLLIPEKFPMPL
jgi:hypothetical protein